MKMEEEQEERGQGDTLRKRVDSIHANPGIVSVKAFLQGLILIVIQWYLGDKGGLGYVGNAALHGSTVLAFLVAKNKARTHKMVSGPSGMVQLDVQLRAFFLGWAFSCGIHLILSGFSVPFGLYVCIMAIFHYTEFLVTSITSSDTLSLDSFLLNHSKEYGIAALGGLIEFFVELYFVPSLKENLMVTGFGVALCVSGEVLRKSAMLTASTNFTHLVRDRKAKGQYLVTSGPYSMCRHPGYAGWFWWSIGTQLVLINPFCTMAYCLAVYRFFRGRIYYEEVCLLSFFGLDYINYQQQVPRTGVPFVSGYISSETNSSTSKALDEENDEDSSSSNEDNNFLKVDQSQLEGYSE